MNTIPQKTSRIYSLDSLRAIMMLLGLVLHSAVTYIVEDYGADWILKDPASVHISNDFIVGLIHSFRMQIFFVVAGFFGSMLFYERRPSKMAKNRMKRIVLPFIVFLILLWPTMVFTFSYTKYLFSGSETALAETLAIFSKHGLLLLIPQSTVHLWFLYYLAMITFLTIVIALGVKKVPKLGHQISNGFNWIFEKTILRIFVFAALMGLIYLWMGTSQVDTSTSLIPVANTFLYYSFFYLTGWVLFKSKHLLSTFKENDWMNTILGLVLFSVHFFLDKDLNFASHVLLNSLIVWFLIFGITGLFIRYGSKHSPIMRYISDSSYWVYLVHLSFAAIIPSFIVDWPIPATLKFLFVMTTTGIICFVSYHYLVRGTFIGQFLNGRKYSRKLSDIREVVSTPSTELVLENQVEAFSN